MPSAQREPAALSRGALLVLALVLAAVWFGNLGHRKLTRPDEGRNAEIAREMVASGDWVTPRLNGFRYFEKPPLQYWATAAAFEAIGATEWTARLWTALTGFLGVVATAFVAGRLASPAAGAFAGAVLGSAALYVIVGHVANLDMGVAFFLSLTSFAFALAQRDGTRPAAQRNWMLLAWAAAALAVLSKGLIGIVLPAAAVAAYVFVQRDWARLRRLHWRAGGALFAAIAAPWFVAVSMANPEFLGFFFVQEHLERFLTKAHGHYEPPWYFVPILLGGLAPWTLVLFAALGPAWSGDREASFRPLRFLLVWVVVVFVFFSLSGSKLTFYIAPIFPALAVLIAVALTRCSRGLLVAQGILAAAAGAALVVLAPGQLARAAKPELPLELLQAYTPWVVAAGAALAIAAGASALLAWRGRRTAAVLIAAGGGLGFAQLAITGHEALAPVYSAYHSVARIKSAVREETPFFSVETFDHTVPFYLGRTVTMVGYKDELAVAIGWDPHNFVPDLATFDALWRAAPAAFAVFHPRDYRLALSRGLPMTVIAEDPRRVFVRKQ